MSTPLVTDTTAAPSPTRATRTLYAALVVNTDLTTSLDALFETEHERRDAVIDTLIDLYEDITRENVEEILAPFGGANATVALEKVIDLAAELDYEPDVHLGEHLVDDGPLSIYSAFTVYGDGSFGIEHYPTRQARLDELRLRVEEMVDDDIVVDHFTEDECKSVVESFLSPTDGKFYLVDAERDDEGGNYRSYGLEG